MSLILSENTGPLMKFALAYLNDVLIFLPCIDSHFNHLREILLRLRKSEMKINPKKCSFLVNKLIFLGNSITPQGIGPDPEKVSAMLQYPAPTDQKKLRCVLGLFQLYKKFIPRYSHMVQTLNRLLGKNIDYKWTSVENDALMTVRKGLKNAPFMEYPTAKGLKVFDNRRKQSQHWIFIESGIRKWSSTYNSLLWQIVTPSRKELHYNRIRTVINNRSTG